LKKDNSVGEFEEFKNQQCKIQSPNRRDWEKDINAYTATEGAGAKERCVSSSGKKEFGGEAVNRSGSLNRYKSKQKISLENQFMKKKTQNHHYYYNLAD
jgi:hypothetical protein